jgi:predicted aldo/keto reductase-like oxidoreductase
MLSNITVKKTIMSNNFNRREFVKALLAGMAMGPTLSSFQVNKAGMIPKRPLGKTGELISIYGYGGWDAGRPEEKESISMMHEAIEAGVTFFDNAWEYNGGRSEEVMGKALAMDGFRQKVFLMTKVCARDYKNAKLQIEESLNRLQTDHVDLLQFHAIQYDQDPERIMNAKEGAVRAVLEARQEGKLKYIGFSGHMFPEVHLKMINMFDWDAVQLPLNVLDNHYNSFLQKVLPVLIEKNIAPLGMKSLAGRHLPNETDIPVKLCRKYALSLPVSTTICGVQTREQLRSDLEIARDFKPLVKNEIIDLLASSEAPARDGSVEKYKNPSIGYGCSFHSEVLKNERG